MKKRIIMAVSAVVLVLGLGISVVAFQGSPKDTQAQVGKADTNICMREIKSHKRDTSAQETEKMAEVPELETGSEASNPVSEEATSEKEQQQAVVKTEAAKQTAKSTETGKAANQQNNSSAKQNAPSHTHQWVKQTKEVHHDATGHNEQVQVKAAWTESIPVYETVAIEVCNACGADITSNHSAHMKEHALKGENAARHTEYIQKQTGTKTITHPAEYTTKWVQDHAAWGETVVTGYRCSCGATK